MLNNNKTTAIIELIERFEELDEERKACTIHDAEAEELYKLEELLNNIDSNWRLL